MFSVQLPLFLRSSGFNLRPRLRWWLITLFKALAAIVAMPFAIDWLTQLP